MTDTAGPEPGTLYLVPTPIGNYADLSPRALETLSAAGVIAAEDTRVTAKLLRHFGLSKRMLSFHEHNEDQRAGQLLRLLREGTSVAVVSDAGTPLVSDPGFRLVRRAVAEGIEVVSLPG
ncbi:MAG TPA: SAM-dependent methyltransferase, partial [Thermoanaerobaculia bacterium]